MNPEPTLFEVLGVCMASGISAFIILVIINKIHLFALKKFSKKD
jgi:hypothetical protein